MSKTIYEVLKNVNLSEKGFTLALIKGDKREDLEDKFTKPYLDWQVDGKFLKVFGEAVETGEQEDEEDEEDREEDTDEILKGGTNITGSEEDDETLSDDDTSKEEETSNDEEETSNEEEQGELEGVLDESDETDEDGFPDFDAMPFAEVKEYAMAHGVDILGLKKKADVVDAIYDELAE